MSYIDMLKPKGTQISKPCSVCDANDRYFKSNDGFSASKFQSVEYFIISLNNWTRGMTWHRRCLMKAFLSWVQKNRVGTQFVEPESYSLGIKTNNNFWIVRYVAHAQWDSLTSKFSWLYCYISSVFDYRCKFIYLGIISLLIGWVLIKKNIIYLYIIFIKTYTLFNKSNIQGDALTSKMSYFFLITPKIRGNLVMIRPRIKTFILSNQHHC